MTDDLLHGPLEDRHRELGASFAEFGGWLMPVSYAGTVSEHNATRNAVGLFDVSHLGKALVRGPGAAEFVNSALTNDLRRIGPGKAQYTLCCTETGGVIDDLIAYYVADDEVFLVPNAANTAAVVAAMKAVAPQELTITDEHRSHAVLAVQGPKSSDVLAALGLPTEMDYMGFADADVDGVRTRVCRTGYTGEHGYELLPPWDSAGVVFDALVAAVGEAGGELAGLGARDTLRTEMGYPLHGHELSLDISPLQARCGWAIGWKKDAFWGRDVLLAEKQEGPRRLLRGLKAVGRGVLRADLTVLDGDDAGGRDDVGHLLADVESRYRAGAHRRGRRDRGRPGASRSMCGAGRWSARSSSRPSCNPAEIGHRPRRRNSLARSYRIDVMTDGPLEFSLARNTDPASDGVRGDILADPGFGRYHTDHMVSIDYDEGVGWHNAAVLPYGPIELDPSAIVLHYAQEVFEGLKAYRWAGRFDRVVPARGQRGPAAFVGAPDRHPRTARAVVHRVAAPTHRRRRCLGAPRRRRGVAVPAAVHLRHRARAGCAPGQPVPLPGDRLAGRRVLQGRHQAGQRVAVHRIRAGQPRRHRRGQVRRQLRRLPAGAGRGRRATAATRWCGWTPSNAATSKRWAG